MTRIDRPLFDHLVYATRDLSAASADLAARTGVEPSGGGRHDGFGTQNRLASLGDGRYLELIGPDPDQPRPAAPLPFSLDSLDRPRLMAWAITTSDLEGARSPVPGLLATTRGKSWRCRAHDPAVRCCRGG